MALTATIHRFVIALSDVDRSVYETLDLRLARHPSESGRYMVTRLLAFALAHEEGIAFSKGGLSSTDEPPVAVHDPTGLLLAWIDVGSPSAERLHKAAKAAERVLVFTHADPALLRREARSRPVYRLDAIEVYRIDPALLDAVEARVGRHTEMEIVRNEGRLYVTVEGTVIEGEITRIALDA
jgi:uncharacterized protein YaeQ